MLPGLFSQVPKPDITRRYKDDDPVGAHGAKIIERSLEFVMDDGDFYSFGEQSVMDYLLPGRTLCKVRYVPLFSTIRVAVPLEAREQIGVDGELKEMLFYKGDAKIDPEEIQFREGRAFMDEEIEEVVDEHVIIERWPWRNFRHQRAKRWKDVGWIDYISYLDEEQLASIVGKRRAKDIQLTVDAAGLDEPRDGSFQATHAEVHEVWFIRDRKTRIAISGVKDEWAKVNDDPLRLSGFWPTPKPLMAIDTNDSLVPVPQFTLYQHQANELDLITKRIAVLMRALKLAGLYAGAEKDTLQKLFDADENQMIPVEDWGSIKESGGVSGLVEWLPVEQVGKVLTALFREREAIVAQIFELTGIADIQRGSTDPRETKGSQVIKAQFANRRTLNPKQEVERYFRDVLRISAEIMSEHFSPETLQRMTGLEVPPEVQELLRNELSREYRIDIETDSTIAPDEEREQANMAKALEAVTAYISALGPLVQQGMIPGVAAIQLLKVYLRKFRWGREIEETLEQIERNPPQPQPDPEAQKMQMEAQMEQQKLQLEAQMEQQRIQADLQKQQAELKIKLQEMQMKLQQMQMEMQLEAQKARMEMSQESQKHQQEMSQDRQTHQQTMAQQKEVADAKALQVRRGNEKRNTSR